MLFRECILPHCMHWCRREVRALCCPTSACALSLSSHPAHLGPHVLVGSWSLCVERLSVIGCGCVSSRSTSMSVFTPSPCVLVLGVRI